MRTIGPELRIGTVAVPAFRVFALAGLGGGITVAMLVTHHLVSQLLVVVAGLVACLGALALRIALTHQGDLVWSEHEAATIGATLVVGLATGSLRDLLDATAVGLLVVLAIGRIGCLFAGCCHGRPAVHGIHYTPAHDLPSPFVGVPLVPVQAIESAWAALLATIGLLLIDTAPAGVTFLVLLAGRATGRFVLEFLRGDSGAGILTAPRWWALGSLILLAVARTTGLT